MATQQKQRQRHPNKKHHHQHNITNHNRSTSTITAAAAAYDDDDDGNNRDNDDDNDDNARKCRTINNSSTQTIHTTTACLLALNFDRGRLPPEPQLGNIEYKLKLIAPTPQRFEHLVTQMKWRLREGNGEAIYEIGVSDSGHLHGLAAVDMRASLHTLSRMAQELGATTTVLRRQAINALGKVERDKYLSNQSSVNLIVNTECS